MRLGRTGKSNRKAPGARYPGYFGSYLGVFEGVITFLLSTDTMDTPLPVHIKFYTPDVPAGMCIWHEVLDVTKERDLPHQR